MASSGAHFAKETKMIQIRGTKIFKSMSGIHFKREAMSSRNKSNIHNIYSSLIPKKLGLNHLALIPLHNVYFVKYDVTVSFMAQVLEVYYY